MADSGPAIGHENPTERVEEEAASAYQRQTDGDSANEDGVDIQIAGEAGANPGE